MRRALLGFVLLGVAGCAAPVPADDDDTTPEPTPAPVGCAPTEWTEPPACGSGPVARGGLLPGPGDAGFDADLAGRVTEHDRLFHAVFAWSTGVNTEVSIDLGESALLDTFMASDSWDFEEATGRPVTDLVTSWGKAAGLYAGVGIAADAYRYGALRDEGAPCVEVDRARELLLRSLEGLHRASAITGVPGVIARGSARVDHPGAGATVETTPLFDETGAPLPEEKDNGTWRDDNSADGAYSDYVWEDSCSRDMLMGWATAYGAVWEVVGLDPTIDAAVKDELVADATALARSLMTVQDSGFDLEIRDADGRRTFHGILHEESIDTVYTPGVTNGPNAMMAAGAAAALATVAQDAEVQEWLEGQLLGERRLHELARDRSAILDFGVNTNFSGYNMVFTGGLLAERLVCDDEARGVFAVALHDTLYDPEGEERQPVEQAQALYDLAGLAGQRVARAWGSADEAPDEAVLGQLVDTLTDFPAAPYVDTYVENCDADEIASGVCVGVDGVTQITVLEATGWNDAVVAAEPIPWSIRPPSNYHWRSNPYEVNRGDPSGGRLLPAVDLRFAYWAARWQRR